MLPYYNKIAVLYRFIFASNIPVDCNVSGHVITVSGKNIHNSGENVRN